MVPASLHRAVDFVVLSPATSIITEGLASPNAFRLDQIYLNKTASLEATGSRTFTCASEQQVQEWQCCIQGVVDMLRGESSLPGLPPRPGRPRVEAIKHDAVRLSWPATSQDQNTSRTPLLRFLLSTKKGQSEWGDPIPVHASTPFAVLRRLDPGTPYSWRVAAVSVLGVGDYSKPSKEATTLRPPTKSPGVPQVLSIGTVSVTLSWTGGKTGSNKPWGSLVSPVHGIECRAYDAAQSAASDPVATCMYDCTLGQCTGDFPGLVSGKKYTFRVAAVSYAGAGPESGASVVIRTLGKPESTPTFAPRIVGATHSEIDVEWDSCEANEGEAPISGYLLQICDGETRAVITTAAVKNANKMRVGGVKPSTAYCFTVAMVNAVGTGPSSPHSVIVRTKGPLSSAPNNFSVTNTPDTIQMTWTPPHLGPHDADLFGYKVFSQRFPAPAEEIATLGPDNHDLDASFLLETYVEGPYNFYVCGTNALGVGPQSNTSTITIARPVFNGGGDGGAPGYPQTMHQGQDAGPNQTNLNASPTSACSPNSVFSNQHRQTVSGGEDGGAGGAGNSGASLSHTAKNISSSRTSNASNPSLTFSSTPFSLIEHPSFEEEAKQEKAAKKVVPKTVPAPLPAPEKERKNVAKSKSTPPAPAAAAAPAAANPHSAKFIPAPDSMPKNPPRPSHSRASSINHSRASSLESNVSMSSMGDISSMGSSTAHNDGTLMSMGTMSMGTMSMDSMSMASMGTMSMAGMSSASGPACVVCGAFVPAAMMFCGNCGTKCTPKQ
jgi:hypothetical protein